eukprot:g10265.t1
MTVTKASTFLTMITKASVRADFPLSTGFVAFIILILSTEEGLLERSTPSDFPLSTGLGSSGAFTVSKTTPTGWRLFWCYIKWMI